MAKEISFEGHDGSIHDRSYWIPAEIVIRPLPRKATVLFTGWKDKAAKEAGKTIVGDIKFKVTGDEFDQYFSDQLLTANSVINQAYKLASEAKVVGDPPKRKRDGTMEEDRRESFFKNAKNV